jgi:hypothetical protein
MWQPVTTAPFEEELELAVIDAQGAAHVLVFPCRRTIGGWINAATQKRVEIEPTHWRHWEERS